MDLTERRAGAYRHPWEVQRFEAYRRILADHGALDAHRVLDVGSGDGWFTDSLADSLPADTETVCWDVNYSESDLEAARPGVVRTRDRPSSGYDLVLALDVLEHVDDPVALIRDELAPLTTAGTQVMVAAPAYQRLFSAHDRALGHHRRYGRRELDDQLAPWIESVERGSLFTSLLPLRAAQVAVERIRERPALEADHGVGGWDAGSTVTSATNAALRADARTSRWLSRHGIRLPGLSHWVIGVVR
ncbi:MAG: methyltransferase domain-containing protein [Ilumatobacteraceae bacterium]